MSAIVLIECVPPSKYGEFVSYIGIVAALAGVLGPIIGGSISEHTTWRWIFLFKYAISSSQIFFVPSWYSFIAQCPFRRRRPRPCSGRHAKKLSLPWTTEPPHKSNLVKGYLEQNGYAWVYTSCDGNSLFHGLLPRSGFEISMALCLCDHVIDRHCGDLVSTSLVGTARDPW